MNPKQIFLSDLPVGTEDHDLYEYFSKFGIITDVFVLKNTRGLLDSRRCGFVTFRDEDAVQKVFDAQPCRLGGNEISVSHARVNKSGGKKPHTKAHIPNQGTSIPTSKDTIFVGRLKPTITGLDLERYFSKFGPVFHTEVATSEDTGIPRGFGFVTFIDRETAQGDVLDACHFLDGGRVDVKPARARPQRHYSPYDIRLFSRFD